MYLCIVSVSKRIITIEAVLGLTALSLNAPSPPSNISPCADATDSPWNRKPSP